MNDSRHSTDPGNDATSRCEYRQVTYRLVPGSRGRARRLAALAGACRFVWNELLDQQEQLHHAARTFGGRAPSPTFFTLSKAFTELRRAVPWLQTMPFAPVRYTLKYQGDAWQRFFEGKAGRPRFKRRGSDSVTLPDTVRIEDAKLWVPRIGWMGLRRRGGNPYPEGRPVRAVLKRVGGKWTACVCYAVDIAERPDDGTVVGVDMNAGQVAVSHGRTGQLLFAPGDDRLAARKRRYQRRMARQVRGSKRRERTRRRIARTDRRMATRRHDWHHRVSRELARATVVVEKLHTAAMIASARGTAEAPGTNVRAKAGLNRVVLATGWSALRAMLAYKAPRMVAVDAAYTSQTCATCGQVDADSRVSRDRFKCVACGHADQADINAAHNIRRRGLALLHGEGRSVQPSPVTREMDRQRSAA